MPIRLRKILSLGKGFRINLSKSGMSASIGRPGATLNIGKRGIRPTVGIPGTGVSYTPSMAQTATASTTEERSPAQNKTILNIAILVISGFFICCILFFCIGMFLFPTDTDRKTASASATSLPIERIIELTFSAANMQTQAAQSPTPLPPPVATSTLAPAIIPVEATATIFIFELQTNAAQPTAYTYETNTPFALSTQQPSSGGNSASFDSNGDGKVTCGDFQTQAAAQQAYNAGFTNLDGNDNDGKACESLP